MNFVHRHGALLGERARADEEYRLHAHGIQNLARGLGMIDQAVIEGDQNAVARQLPSLQDESLDLFRRRNMELFRETLDLLRESVRRNRMDARIGMRMRVPHVMIVHQEKLSRHVNSRALRPSGSPL